MKFTLDPTAEDPKNGRFHVKVSENRKWAIWIYPVMYGFRVEAGIFQGDFNSVDYCGGASEENIALLYTTIERILENFDESATIREIESIFPRWNIRPVHKDTVLLEQLNKLSGVSYEDEDLEEIPSLSGMRRRMNLDDIFSHIPGPKPVFKT